MPSCSNHSSSAGTTHRVVKQEDRNPSSPKKRWVPSKFKQSPVKKGKLSKDQTVYTVCGKPGYALAYVLKQNGDNGFFYPFQKMVDEEDRSILHLNIIGVVSRIVESTQTPIRSGGYHAKQFLCQMEDKPFDDMKTETEAWGQKVTNQLNNCDYVYPTTFVYGGDRSGVDGKDIKHFLLQSDIINKFAKKAYAGYIDDRDFYNESELFDTMFSDTDTDVLWELFH